ncbi:MAG: beta strand repeat-containing protein [Isosphaeraceae bacterium]
MRLVNLVRKSIPSREHSSPRCTRVRRNSWHGFEILEDRELLATLDIGSLNGTSTKVLSFTELGPSVTTNLTIAYDDVNHQYTFSVVYPQIITATANVPVSSGNGTSTVVVNATSAFSEISIEGSTPAHDSVQINSPGNDFGILQVLSPFSLVGSTVSSGMDLQPLSADLNGNPKTGSLTNPTLTISSGGALGGSGTVNSVTVNQGGILFSPSFTAAPSRLFQLRVNGSLSFNGVTNTNSNFVEAQAGNTPADNVSDNTYGWVNASGNVDISGANLNVVQNNTSLGTLYKPAVSTLFNILSASQITGQFLNATAANNYTVESDQGGQSYRVLYSNQAVTLQALGNVQVTATPATTTTTYGASQTYDVTVAPASNEPVTTFAPTGSIHVFSEGNDLGVYPLNEQSGTTLSTTISVPLSSLGAGNHTILFQYEPGQASLYVSGTDSPTVDVIPAPVTVSIASATPKEVWAGDPVTFVANVGPIPAGTALSGQVQFVDVTDPASPIILGTAAQSETVPGQFSFTTSQIREGARTIQATYVADPNFTDQGPDPTTLIIVHPSYIVTNTNDSGAGSLRAAVDYVNSFQGRADVTDSRVLFQIPGSGVHTISPTSPLPPITEPVMIDATSQPGFNPQTAIPVIEINGVNAGAGASGFEVDAGSSTIEGFLIDRFQNDGIALKSDGNLVADNEIGADAAGTPGLGNQAAGIGVGGTNNTIGGTGAGAGNLISGNTAEGIFIQVGGNLVQGNMIGTNVAGSAAQGNGLSGITLQDSTGNSILDNLISGNGVGPNQGFGIALVTDALAGESLGATRNLIQGNRIGTDSRGETSLPNVSGGIGLRNAVNNTIGGTGPGQGNLISGNGGDGISGQSASNNLIGNNTIGLSLSGASLGNSLDGINLNTASNNTISGNIISANGINQAAGGIQDAAGINLVTNDTKNTIADNMIGTDASGNKALGNSLHGIFLGDGCSNNTIGGPMESDRNVISGNGTIPVADPTTQGGVGVYIFGTDTLGNNVQGNLIGTNAADTAALGNSIIGVLINQSSGNTVQGNVVSGNQLIGVEIAGVAGGPASGNLVQSNKIGTNLDGTTAIPNKKDGVFINNAASNTIIGNLISANGTPGPPRTRTGIGIQLFGQLTTRNVIQGNKIGTDATGHPTLPNLIGGFFVDVKSLNNQLNLTGPGQANQGQVHVIPGLFGLTDPGSTASVAARSRSHRGKATQVPIRTVARSHPAGPSAHISRHLSPSGGKKRSPHRVSP